ncbi:hypothetical protein Sste5344_007510 [Sporothrix stenoceras]
MRGPEGAKMPFAQRIWMWELCASLFSIACVGGITAFLILIDNMPLEHWQRYGGKIAHYVSPTFVTSLLSTVGQSSCMLALAEILSQLKWEHFAGPAAQPLSDLQMFDRASRGPFGALQFLFNRKHKRILVFFACVAMALALIMDPFVQLVFSFPVRKSAIYTTLGEVVKAPPLRSTMVYDSRRLASHNGQCYGPGQIDSQLQAAIVAPIWNSMRSPNVSCSYDLCEWPGITTLGICSDYSWPRIDQQCAVNMVDGNTGAYSIVCNTTVIDDYYRQNQKNFTAVFETTTASNGSDPVSHQPMWNSSVVINTNTTSSPSVKLATVLSIQYELGLPWQDYIWTDGRLGSSPSKPVLDPQFPDPNAQVVYLSLCARTYDFPSYANSTAYVADLSLGWYSEDWPLNVSLSSSVPPATVSNKEVSFINLTPNEPIHPNATSYTLPNPTFQINQCDYQNLAEYLADLFTTEYTETNATADPTAPMTQTVKSEIGRALYENGRNLQTLMKSIADSMTDVIRNSAQSTAVDGTGYNSVTFISVTWYFVALPWLVVVLTFILLVGTITNSGGDALPTWKSSNAAMLFHGLVGWDGAETTATNPVQLSAQAENMRARIGHDENGRRAFVRE